MMGALGSSNISVESMYMVPVSARGNMFHRPLTVHAGHRELDAFKNVLHGEMSATAALNTTPETYRDLTGIIRPSDFPTSMVPIVNGWGTERLRYILTLRVDMDGIQQLYYVQGYTDYHDPVNSGALDENMSFVINSITVVNEVRTPQGIQHVVVQSNNVVFNPLTNATHMQGMSQSEYVTARPEDIFNGVQVINAGDENIIDTRPGLTADPVAMARGLSSPTNYMSVLINSWVAAAATTDIGYGVTDTYSAARATASSGSLIHNPLLSKLADITGSYHVTGFTMSDLIQIDPDTVHKTKYFSKPENTSVGMIGMGGEAEHWDNTSVLTSTANHVTSILTGIMMDHMCGNLSFVSTNKNGQPVTQILTKSYNIKTSVMQQDMAILSKIETSIVPVVSKNNNVVYELSVSADAFGDTWIDISMGNEPMTRYCNPSFADSLTSNMVMPSRDMYNGLVTGMGDLLTAASEVQSDL